MYKRQVSGTITGSAGAAFKYASRTNNDVEFSDMTISNNAIGIETDGSGDFTLTDIVMSNTKDVVMTGSSNMDFIEGSVDTTAVEVTGTGEFSRQRQLDITLQANVSNVAEDVTDTPPLSSRTAPVRSPAWLRRIRTVWPTTCSSPRKRWTAAV